MNKENKFNAVVNVTMNVDKLDESGKVERKFHEASLDISYPGMDYIQFVALQQALIHLLQILNNMGWTGGEALGFDLMEIEAIKSVATGAEPNSPLKKEG